MTAAEQAEVQLLISCPWHYTAHARQARELVKNGSLGEVRMISVLMTNPVSHLIRGEQNQVTHGVAYLLPHHETYSDPAIAGGGQAYAQVSHAAAYLTFLTGLRPAEVFAAFHYDGGRMDIYDAATIRVENGCLVSLASTGATPTTRRDYEVRLFGTRGLLFLDLWCGTMRFVSMDGSTPIEYPDLSESEIYPEQAPARDLIDSIVNKRPNGSPGTLGWSSMEVIEAACQSARSGANVVIRAQA